MRYPYYCSQCDAETEIVKSMDEIDRVEKCECGHPMARKISEKISFKNEKVADNQTYFHPTLGCVVNSNSQVQRIAKERGFIELGNESPDSVVSQKSDGYSLSDRDYHDVIGIGDVRGG
jgi:putative FmdB family regulatory protein